MSNRETAELFLSCYQKHDYIGMIRCLDPKVRFHDMAFENLRGPDVEAMWFWFCVPSADRQNPIEVLSYEITGTYGNVVSALYRVRYLYNGKRLVDYVIHTVLTLRNGRIANQCDASTLSPFAFARMAFGYPVCLLAFTPLFRWMVRLVARRKLEQFKRGQIVSAGHAARTA